MVIGQSFIDTRNESHETDASVVADSFTSESLILTKTIDVYPENAPYKRKVSPANAEEFNHSSTSRKNLVIMIFLIGRKQVLMMPMDLRHKRGCNCKRSKCTKNTANVFNLIIPTV
ncbi:hypothetical protein MTR_2g049090 [Medicago truncatula]|uniref:Uncharacterized protein n=1 Tax=Medicago truncatula TaxID=3880 RepID=G7IGN0_MEDTR|nr:hypothetical protein MTR_2g049090 [Medicago truncatula]